MLEQLPLVGVGEAVELKGVLAHVQVCLDDDLLRLGRQAEHARGRVDEVADAVDVEHEPVAASDRDAAEPRDHPATILSRGGASAWQIATASASEA